MALAPEEVEGMRSSFHGASFALFQLESPLPTVEAALRLAKEEGCRTILDPAPAQPLSPALLGLVDILTPNETEACLLTGRAVSRLTPDDAPAVAAALRQRGPRAVILKLGDQGCYYDDGSARIHVNAFRVQAVDTTAAGDIFNAAVAVALAGGKHEEAALRFACAASAISVTRRGAQASVPARSEVDEFLALTSWSA
jgi:ribokinase